MDDYLPLYRAILRAEKNNKTCDKLSFDYKTPYGKIEFFKLNNCFIIVQYYYLNIKILKFYENIEIFMKTEIF